MLLTLTDRRGAVLQLQLAVSERRAARLIGDSRTTIRYRHRRQDDSSICQRL